MTSILPPQIRLPIHLHYSYNNSFEMALTELNIQKTVSVYVKMVNSYIFLDIMYRQGGLIVKTVKT